MLPRFKFRLIGLFCFVSAIACGLAAVQYWVRVPMRSGKMYSGLCYAKDWDRLVATRQAEKHGDFTMYVFDALDPKTLCKDFSAEPQFWCELAIPQIADFNYRALRDALPYNAGRNREVDCPVGGRHEKRGRKYDYDREVMDLMSIGGVFQESMMCPKSYTIDCVVVITTSPLETRNTITSSNIAKGNKGRLRYTGHAQAGLMVFSRPLNDGLVHLVILDLR